MRPLASPGTENSEEERAFLQKRVALFWKIMFFIVLIGTGLGVAGALKRPGVDLLLTLFTVVQTGLFWAVCRSGTRSLRFSRAMDAGGILLAAINSGLLGRFLLFGFARDHALATPQATTMADAFVTMLSLETGAVQVAIRAALIPSRPRRTFILTALFGLPIIVAASLLVPTAAGGLTWRAATSDAYPWMPPTLAMMWSFAVIACTVISWVIYGLRAEVRRARKFGQYVLERKLGEGAMGVVYRATHAMLRRPAAIKLLLKDRASELELARFEREVQHTSLLVHPNTISIFDFGRTAEGVFYYVMEYLDGIDLQRLVDDHGPLEPARAINILAQISGALAEAHALGLIHRDIKPANIVLTERPDEPDVVKVVDFGLVKKFGRNLNESASGDTLTGTPLYMSPEAISRPDTVDGRSDLYALGAVAYFLLTGRQVFEATTVVEVCSKHMLEVPVAPSRRLGRALPADLEALVLGCLAKDRDERPASAAALRAALLACADAGHNDVTAARAWWRAHRASQKDNPSAVDDETGPRRAPMTIDLGGRSPEAVAP
ncbi:MAG: serine/threonine kinase [Myxococcales bacterium]|nr:serine/threonine kinase [Myxococcales bacterium]